MSLGRKIAVLIGCLGVCIALGSYAAIRSAILPAFEEFESESSRADLARVEQVLDAQLAELAVLNGEYAHWDDTYRFALGQQPDYVEANLDASYWRGMNIELVAILNASGEARWVHATHPDTGAVLAPEDFLLEPLGPDHPFVSHADGETPDRGFLKTRFGPMIVSSESILTTYEQGPPAGWFLLGRFLREDETRTYASRTGTEFRMAAGKPGKRDAATTQEAIDDTIVTRRGVQDVAGRYVGTLEVRTPRRVTAVGERAILAAVAFIVLISAAFLSFALVFLRRLVVDPVNELAGRMAYIRITGDLSESVEEDRRDEIGDLGQEFGRMTSRLREVQNELETTRDVAVEASRAKSDFLARMSHEIRTPMNGVFGMTELLKHTNLDVKQRRFADTIGRSAEHLLAIINDILDFSKVEAGKLELETVELDLRTIVEEILDGVATEASRKNIEVINGVSPGVPASLVGDPVRLTQVLANLVANAVKFTEEGEIFVRVTAEQGTEESWRVRFRVVDTGMGIAPENQKRVFESFAQEDSTVTRAYGGTGLGLAISQQLVGLMGGELRMASVPGEGTEFEFELAMPGGTASQPNRAGLPDLTGRRVLVADDTATLREMLAEQLGACGAHTESAASAAEAITVLEAARACGQPFELLVVDAGMPRFGGLELIRRLRTDPSGVSLDVLLMTPLDSVASDAEVAELRIGAQLTKPVQQSRLYAALTTVVEERRANGDEDERARPRGRFQGRVLLVEDNPINQAVVLGMLEALGVHAEVAVNGLEAVERVAAGGLDLVLMDCQMPELDGYAATREIRRREAEIGQGPVRVLALTADAMTGDRERCLAAGMDDYLSKPFSLRELEAALSSNLEKAGDTPLEVTPPVDEAVWSELSKLDAGGAASVLETTLRLFAERSPEMREGMRKAVEDGDLTRLRERAHTLKSSSANIGANVLSELCLRLEAMAREESLGGAEAVQAEVEAEYDRVMKLVHTELQPG